MGFGEKNTEKVHRKKIFAEERLIRAAPWEAACGLSLMNESFSSEPCRALFFWPGSFSLPPVTAFGQKGVHTIFIRVKRYVAVLKTENGK